ncbi:LysR substrate-binding domain-containing protein [Serratia ficaria]|uniref:HTH-type transcriptional regulator YofA n=1 Tax=Serratia ficaria TaxID=61651 RepID=A0A240C5B2_SERFI|nr:LysR substrate-binding domain-containing protein [Serratia ficaria]REF44072.1 LysR family transcriptional regulator [Serratia ficaria]CAI0740216.1 HTH-type transcriptional regulator YofA [Serratia ficaria]CAI0756030.1 HTH-type transcriptional regulator YofA [Serratia ficaria]CAI0767822.1 HTH-type transcriptional regulator YofA [Serratia ficaria]CAI1925584.1 HTH-type transcriptional regulator YofA [Serratia ficaria]
MIRELKTFLMVAKEGTFAAAGNKIGLTQAAVSAQMQRLEADLNFALFDRSGRNARLNQKGLQLVTQAQELLTLYDGLGERLTRAIPGKIVTIGAIASVQRTLLPDALTLFSKQSSGCRTRVIPGLSMDLINLVDAGEIDMAAVLKPPFALPQGLQWSALTHEPFHLIVPKGVAGDDIAGLLRERPFIRYDRSSFGGRLVDRFLREMDISVTEICEVDELEAILKLVSNGVGVALLPQIAAWHRWPSSVRALSLGQKIFYRDVGLIHRPLERLDDDVRRISELIIMQARRDSLRKPR